MKNLQNLVPLGILLALLWIAWELHGLNSGIGIDVNTPGDLPFPVRVSH